MNPTRIYITAPTMGNRLRDTIFPSQEKKREMEEFVARCRAENLERRKQIRLVRANDTDSDAPLYCAEPFSGFTGDCEYCDHYCASPFAFVTGGDCMKHGRGCGYAFTCKDNTSPYNDGWDEFEKIKKEGFDVTLG